MISEEYRAQLSQVHRGIFPWGGAVEGSVPKILKHALELDCKTILDYGAGYGSFKQTADKLGHNFDIREYEPGFADKAGMPEPADYVVCVDVLEHIEPEHIDAVIAHLHRLMNKAGYFAICTVPAYSNLPDGRNKHLIVQPAEWWLDKLEPFFGYTIELKSKAHVKLYVQPKGVEVT